MKHLKLATRGILSLGLFITSLSFGGSAEHMLANISPQGTRPGVVVASPSQHDPDYWYHWTRDGALVMDSVVGLYERSSSAAQKTRLAHMMVDYIGFMADNQRTANASGGWANFFAGFGEPKFNVNGTAFNAPWGRPQNDGPALRAITLIHWINVRWKEGDRQTAAQLYNAEPTRSIVKGDLEFVAHHWNDYGFDLWEEVRGKHFYTKIVQRRALVEGALLARTLGDNGAADYYNAQAQALEPSLDAHFNQHDGFIVTHLERNGGMGGKPSNIDSSVILGVLHGASAPDLPFGLSDERVMATAALIERTFAPLYAINRSKADRAGQPMAPAIGRYPEDIYNGTGVSIGNPWFLTTNAMGEYYYRLANGYAAAGAAGLIQVGPFNQAFFAALPGAPAVHAGEKILASDPRFAALVAALREHGDAYLRRVQRHQGPGGVMSEQFNRDTGLMQGAHDLTWSYASHLTALWARENAMRSIARLPSPTLRRRPIATGYLVPQL